MGQRIFAKSFTQQEPIPQAGIDMAVEVMKSGRLHRYNLVEGEPSHASLLEAEYAALQQVSHCLACASGGYAIQLALRVCGVQPGDKVYANAYTLAPVPGAIHAVGAQPVLIEIDENYHIDMEDFEAKAKTGVARTLLLSHMRGHIADMDRLAEICDRHAITLIEDCAHTMGAKWRGVPSGNFGKVAAFSAQTYKHINSGEGGFLTTNDAEIAARAIVSSGSYMLYQRHGTAPQEDVFRQVRLVSPNYSGRMDQLRAAILRAQLPLLASNIDRWNERYQLLHDRFSAMPAIDIPARRPEEFYVGSSIQFRASGLDRSAIPAFLASCAARGVELKWFGESEPKGFTSRYDSWAYLDDRPNLPRTLSILEKTLDMRIPLTFDLGDCALIADIIGEEIAAHAKG